MKGIIITATEINQKWKKKRKKLKENNLPISCRDLIIYRNLMNNNIWSCPKINMEKHFMLLKLTFLYCLHIKEKLSLYNCEYDILNLIGNEIHNYFIGQMKTIKMIHMINEAPIYDPCTLRRTYRTNEKLCICWVCKCHRNITNKKVYKSKYCGIIFNPKALEILKQIIPLKADINID